MAASTRHDALDHLWIHESSRADLVRARHAPRLRRGRGCAGSTDASGRPLPRPLLVDVAGAARSRPRGHRRGLRANRRAAVASAGPIYFTTEGAVELAERLAARVRPATCRGCFLTSSGSEATETAIKLARQYHRLRGDHHRFKFISRYGSYHGAGMGGTSIGGPAAGATRSTTR